MNDRTASSLAERATIYKERVPNMMTGWKASLKLDFDYRADRTLLVKREHHGPLVIQKLFYPEGGSPAHGVIIHPPGGVAGGDHLQLEFNLNDKAESLLTTPGATKWYKAAGRKASQHLDVTLKGHARLEWLPQENILFDGADVALSADISLSDDAVFSSWEIVCLGRRASGENWLQGHLSQRLSIKRNAKLIWNEASVLSPDKAVMHSISGLRGQVVFGSFVVAAGAVPQATLEACRAMRLDSTALYGVSALPEIFTARYIGQCAQEARHYFEMLWQCLRPWYSGKPAIRPRIWAT
jgi:urease accessory protein